MFKFKEQRVMNSFYTAEQVCLSGSNLTRSRRKYFIIHHRDMSRMNIFFSDCSSLQKSPSYKGTDCIGSYKSNYHTIMTTMVPFPIRNLGCGSHILIFDTRTVLDLQKFESSNHNDALCKILYLYQLSVLILVSFS